MTKARLTRGQAILSVKANLYRRFDVVPTTTQLSLDANLHLQILILKPPCNLRFFFSVFLFSSPEPKAHKVSL